MFGRKKNNLSKRKFDDLKKKVFKYLAQNSNQSYNYKQIASALSKDKNKVDKNQVLRVLGILLKEEKIKEIQKGKFKALVRENFLEGRIEITSSGNAYVIVEDLENDVFIHRKNVGKAFNGDTVQISTKQVGKKAEGKVLEIISRNRTTFVGIFEKVQGKDFGFVIVDDKRIHKDFYIPKEKVGQAKDGEKVLMEFKDWQKDADSPIGRILKVLGQPGDHDVEIHSILAEYGLPYEFPEEVERFANEIDTSISTKEIKKRKDLRKVTTFTIDPADAKDFDDALSFEKLENGHYSVGIHIADVSHYVTPGSILDNEAYERATSVYLVDRVVPMLPEVLSNKVCSLRPNEEKYTFSAIFELDEQGKIHNQWFGRTVIYSDRRFTYEEAQKVIETAEGDLAFEITTLDAIAKKMRAQRMKDGAISFDKTEVKFNLDQEGNPVGIFFKTSKDANKLIEEFMLLANRKVSEFVTTKAGKNPSQNTFIYRIHDDPNPDKLLSLKQFVGQFGYDVKINGRKEISTSLNRLLTDVKGKGEENMVETLAMRCMSKAIYSTENIGHYGLSFDFYSHFTSPIRRYPDVLAHRLLQHYLDGGKSVDKEEYEEMCNHSSNRERLASDAERDSIKYMQVKYMQDQEGQTFDGVISGVTEWGIYVQLPDSLSEGLIRYRSFHDDDYRFEAKEYSAIGQRTGNTYRLGDKVTIKVIRANLEAKQLDFEMVDKVLF